MKRIASQNFKLGEDLVFKGFEDGGVTDVDAADDLAEAVDLQIDLWANMSIPFTGEAPESYRTLNSMVMDWVDEHESAVKALLNEKVPGWLKDTYRDIDISDLDGKVDDYIWEDQVDYMAEVDEDAGRLSFTLELVIDVTDVDDVEGCD